MSEPAVFLDTFDGENLDLSKWVPAHLPQWSSRQQAAARYSLEGGLLTLRVDADQPPWCPEFDTTTKVSSLQTGVLSGPLGSGTGQHRFKPGVVVREEQAEQRLYIPHFGRLEVRFAAIAEPTAMVAFWMIGFEDQPEHSGEICVAEIFGRDVGASSAKVGMGVHPFGDLALTDEWEQVELPIDATDFHTYAATWEPGRVTFAVDGEPVKTVGQAPDYPMQLMLGVYEFPGTGPAPTYPLELRVAHVRGEALAR